MSLIDFYYMPPSPPCRAVLMVMKELDIPVNLKMVNILKGEQHSAEYMKLNPLKTVPAIDDNGFILTESRAIMAYLVNKYAPDHSLYPLCPQKRADIDRWMNFDLGFLYADQMKVFYPILFQQKDLDPEADEAFQKRVKVVDDQLEGQSYLLGDNLTLADISVLASLTIMGFLDYDFSPFVNVSLWMDRLEKELPYYAEVNAEPIKQLKLWYEDKKACV